MSVQLTLDLPTIFRCAVELAEAAAAVDPTEWAALPVDIEGHTSPHFERWMERHHCLQRIEEETERLKCSLGATGPLGHAGCETDAGPKWENYDRHFNNSSHDRVVRLALMKLATAAIDLSGFAAWRERQWAMRKTGLRLLTWGLAQLWEGMSDQEQSGVRDRLQRTHKAVGWPGNPGADSAPYDGPEEIPLADQYRVVSNYVSCHRNYLDDVQAAQNVSVQQAQEKFLRRATVGQFVETADRAEKALRARANRDFDSPAEWGELHTKAFGPLACLRRAKEVPPVEAWPAATLKQSNLLAEAAGQLLNCVGGTPEAKASQKPGEAEKALGAFTRAANQLREIAKREPADQPQPARGADRTATLGQLLRDLEASERAFAANSRTAERVEAEQGSGDAHWWRLQAAALKFQPDPARMPGIDRIEVLCDHLAGGTGLTAASVRQLRAHLCQLKKCSPQAADALSLVEAVDALATAGPAESAVAAKPGEGALSALLRVFTNGLADDRIEKAAQLLSDGQLSANEKLTKIDALIRFPATASAEQLGEMLGVTKQAVLKTDWWTENRKGEKDNEIGRRRAGHQKRAKDNEPPGTNDDD